MLYDPKWKAKADLPTIFERAAAAIEKHGHSIGQLENSRGQMCVWGALGLVVDGDACKASTATHLMLNHLLPFTGGENAINWNNRTGRTKEEVVSMLRTASAVLAGAV